jgi:hypothetical protein
MTDELPPIPHLLSGDAHEFLALCFIRAPPNLKGWSRLGDDEWPAVRCRRRANVAVKAGE